MTNRRKPVTQGLPTKAKEQRKVIEKAELLSKIEYLCNRADSLPENHPIYEKIIIQIEKLNIEFQVQD